MTGDNSVQIMRAYEIQSAPTGESARYECSDGSTWRDQQPFERADGERHGERIYPNYVAYS